MTLTNAPARGWRAGRFGAAALAATALLLFGLLSDLGSAAQQPGAESEPPGTRWHRIELDINGDGRPEILVAREFAGRKAGDNFDVLSPGPDGQLTVWGSLEFNPAMGFRVDIKRQRLFVISPLAVSEFTVIEHELKPGLRVLSRRTLQQWGSTEAEFEREHKALTRYWAGSRAVETYAESGGASDPVWLRLSTGRPVAGLRRLDGKGLTKAPLWIPALREHFLDRQRVPSTWRQDGYRVTLIEADLMGDAALEILLSLPPQSPGFEIYARVEGGYRFLGRLPVRADEEFRIDFAARTVVADRYEAQVTYKVTSAGAREVSRRDRMDRTFEEFKAQQALRAEFNAAPNNPLLEASLVDFKEAVDAILWKRKQGGAIRGVDFNRRVVNVGRD